MGLTHKLHRLAITQMTHYQSKIVELKTRKKDIEQAVKDLPSPYREAIHCRYIEGMTIDATARKLHYASTTIRRHLERGREIIEGKAAFLIISGSGCLLSVVHDAMFTFQPFRSICEPCF